MTHLMMPSILPFPQDDRQKDNRPARGGFLSDGSLGSQWRKTEDTGWLRHLPGCAPATPAGPPVLSCTGVRGWRRSPSCRSLRSFFSALLFQALGGLLLVFLLTLHTFAHGSLLDEGVGQRNVGPILTSGRIRRQPQSWSLRVQRSPAYL